MKEKITIGVLLMFLMLGGIGAQAGLVLVGSLTTPESSGLFANGGWNDNSGGYRVTWTITQNGSLWHYKYEFTNADGGALNGLTSHFIIELSENILPEDLFNFSGDYDDSSIGTFGPAPGNPGFPTGKSIFGVKIDLNGAQTVVEFDSTRAPMWGDFYAKGGQSSNGWNYVYNVDLGVTVANPNDFLDTPVDAGGTPLFKILVPDTIPEPATLVLLGLGGVMSLATRKRRA